VSSTACSLRGVGVERAGGGGVGGRLVHAVGVRPRGWGGLGGTLLGPEESGAGRLVGFWVAGFLVVVWLLDSGREHLCSCFAQGIPFGGCPVFVVFVCVATSYEGRMVDALASRADEGRRSLR
jgi:hypothetical protein